MREQLEKRLADLKVEFETGQRKIADLESQLGTMRTTLLRISGAIQVLEEELGKSEAEADRFQNGSSGLLSS
jgi:predicted  nucleic acid-binding Zn-ribbon protein